jgi:NhaA family Na+:H+ antiporter
MSQFIAGLALEGMLLDAAKIGTLAGSGLSAIVGLAVLAAFLPRLPIRLKESTNPG